MNKRKNSKSRRLCMIMWTIAVFYLLMSLICRNIPNTGMAILMLALAYRTNKIILDYDD